MNINFEYYKIFYHVAKASSISAAARELCISQPAVSQAVKALEQAIGIELFIRTKKGVSLTNAGEILYSTLQRDTNPSPWVNSSSHSSSTWRPVR